MLESATRFNHLQDERVDTSLLKLVDDAQTPFTGVIEFELGNSMAINWPNHMEVHLDIRDIDRLEQRFGWLRRRACRRSRYHARLCNIP